MQTLKSYAEQFIEIADNPFSYFFLSIIVTIITLLIIAIYNKKLEKTLRKYAVLAEGESPQSFLTWLVTMLVTIKLIQVILIQPFMVDGGSMLPNFTDKDIILVDKISYKLNSPKRGDVVVFKFLKTGSNLNGKYFVKRLIALPGDTVIVENGVTKITTSQGELILPEESFVKYVDVNKNTNLKLKNDEYFVMGDNRAGSYDSRAWGPIKSTQLSGRAVLEIFNNFSLFPQAKNENYWVK